MRRLHILVLAGLVLSALLLTASTLYQRGRQDDTIPVITCPGEPLELSVKDGEAALLQGVTAYDEKDGDLTAEVMVQSVSKSGDLAAVTYAVVDSDHHVATRQRALRYTDYVPPRFVLTEELRYPVGARIQIRDRITASDVLDGDLSDRIRVTSSTLTSYNPGTYPAVFEVTNSMGDTSTVTLDIVIRDNESGEPRIALKQYLVYRKAGDPFDPMAYLDSVSGGDRSAVQVQLPEGGLTAGTCAVTYTCRGAGGTEGSTTLYVITE